MYYKRIIYEIICMVMLITACDRETNVSAVEVEMDSEITVDEQENEGDNCLNVIEEVAGEKEFVYYDLKEKEYATIDLDSNEIEKYREEFREDIEIKCDPDRIDSIAWPDDIAPYMSYDWINDERIHVGEFYNTGLSMQLADINGDGQREMLISAAYYPMEDETYIYTVEDASVIYLGKIHAGENKYEREGREWKEMDMGDDYFPIDIVGIYRNNSGEVRCLSEIVNGATISYGYRQIFEIAINGRSIEEKRVVWIRCHQGQYFYGWEIEGEMEDWDKYEWKEDEQGHREIQDEFNLYMNGYYPIETSHVTSTYRIPRLAAILDDEEQNNIRYNIRWGFAEALGIIEI